MSGVSQPMRSRLIISLGLIILAGAAAAFFLTQQPEPAAPERPALLPAIRDFMAANPGYGNPLSAGQPRDDGGSKLQEVTTDAGNYLFKVSGEEVEKVAAPSSPPKTETPKPTGQLPKYEILSQSPLGSGKSASVLVPSLSISTPANERWAAFVGIAKKEGFTSSTFYRTREAYKADYDASYADANPEALRSGLLGGVSNGVFTPGEALVH